MADFTDVLIPSNPLLIGEYTDPDIVVFFAATEEPPDKIAPVVDLVSPLTGAVLPATQVVIDVTDDIALRDVIIYVAMGAGREVIFGGELEGFAPNFAQKSSRSPIAGGYRYSLRRVGGWYASPTFHALAFDQGGNQT